MTAEGLPARKAALALLSGVLTRRKPLDADLPQLKALPPRDAAFARALASQTLRHLGALEAKGSTIIVLAEGITYFRKKRAFAELQFDDTNVLAISQFPPTQPWTAGAAMTRNAVIAGLSHAMLVVEAGEKGGTLNAGIQAIEMGRPVFAIAYSDDPPAGNEILFERGARSLRSQNELFSALDELTLVSEAKQLAIGE